MYIMQDIKWIKNYRYVKQKHNNNDSENGILSIEASIALSVLLFFVFFLMDFGMIYRAQNYIAHGAVQTTKTLSYKSYEYNTIQLGSTELALSIMSAITNAITNEATQEQNLKLKWKSLDNWEEDFEIQEDDSQEVKVRKEIEGNKAKEAYKECAELVFYNTAGKDETTVKKQMKTYGIKDLAFSDAKKTKTDFSIEITYKVELKYPFLIERSDITSGSQIKIMVRGTNYDQQ